MQWILLMTLYASSGKPLETLKFEGYASQKACADDASTIPLQVMGYRREVAKTTQACIQVHAEASKNQG